jgi:hypothetical protein
MQFVDLPQPEGPMKTANRPSSSRPTPLMTLTAPKTFAPT